MKYIHGIGVTKNNLKQTFILATAAILMVQGLTLALSSIFSPKVDALTGYTSVPFTPAEVATYIADRSAPSGGYRSTSYADRTDVLELSIDNLNTSTHANSDAFYNTEGIKKDITDSDAIRADLYIDSSWLTKNVRAGIWGVGYNSANSISFYPIVEFTTSGHTGWRVWNGSSWTNLATLYNADAWNTLEIKLDADTGFINYVINGTKVNSQKGLGTEKIGEVIFNNYNYETLSSDNYDVRWSDFRLGSESPDSQTNTTEIVYKNTSAGENLAGWMFGRDPANATPYQFSTSASSSGGGSLYVSPISSTPAHKFIGELFNIVEIDDLNSASYDFRIGSGGNPSDAAQYYLNVYANYGESSPTKFYDCRYDVIPAVGSTGSFTTVTFDPTQSYTVSTRTGASASPYTCPSVPAEMNLQSVGSKIRAFAINLGDTGASDQGLDGYFDKFVLDTTNEVKTFDFEKDSIRPNAAFTKPTGEAYKNSVPVEFEITDNESGLKNAVVNVYNSSNTLLSTCGSASNLNGAPSHTIICTVDTSSYAEGVYTLKGGGFDMANNNRTVSTTFIVDKTRPLANFVKPLGENYLNSVDVEFNMSDPHGLNNMVVNIYNSSDTLLGTCGLASGLSGVLNHTLNCTIDITGYADGVYTLKGGGFDVAGNNKTITTTFVVDRTPPATPINLIWTPDGGSAMASGGSTNVQKGILSWEDLDASVDHYKYYFWTDIPGYFEGQSNAWTTEGSQYITQTPSGGSIWTDFYTHQGTYFFCIKAIDAVGNSSDCSDTFSVVYDNIAPGVPVHISPANNSVQNFNMFWFDWDDVSGASSYEVQFSQSDSTDSNGALNVNVWSGDSSHNQPTASQAWSSGANGTWYWQVRSVDLAGNKSAWSAPWKMTIDMVAPTVLIVSPTNSLTNTSQEVRITVQDPNLRHYWVKVTKNGSTILDQVVLSASVTNKLVATLTDDGNYVVTVAARDSAGGGSDTGNRSADVVKTLTIDSTAPVIDLLNINVSNDKKLSFDLNASDSGSGLQIVAANIYNETNTGSPLITLGSGSPTRLNVPHGGLSYGTNTNNHNLSGIDVSGLPSGTYTIRAYAKDHAGNERRFQLAQFTVDNTAPVSSFAGLTTTDTTPALSGTVDDDSATVKVTVDGVEYTAAVSSGAWSIADNVLSTLAVGVYDVSISSTDVAGNNAVQNFANSLTISAISVPTVQGVNIDNSSNQGSQQSQSASNNTPAPSTRTVATNNSSADEEESTENTTEEEQTGEVKQAVTESTGTEQGEENSGSGSSNNWWLWVIIAIIVGGLLYFLYKNLKDDEAEK